MAKDRTRSGRRGFVQARSFPPRTPKEWEAWERRIREHIRTILDSERLTAEDYRAISNALGRTRPVP